MAKVLVAIAASTTTEVVEVVNCFTTTTTTIKLGEPQLIVVHRILEQSLNLNYAFA